MTGTSSMNGISTIARSCWPHSVLIRQYSCQRRHIWRCSNGSFRRDQTSILARQRCNGHSCPAKALFRKSSAKVGQLWQMRSVAVLGESWRLIEAGILFAASPVRRSPFEGRTLDLPWHVHPRTLASSFGDVSVKKNTHSTLHPERHGSIHRLPLVLSMKASPQVDLASARSHVPRPGVDQDANSIGDRRPLTLVKHLLETSCARRSSPRLLQQESRSPGEGMPMKSPQRVNRICSP
jgi:hypothetical protein